MIPVYFHIVAGLLSIAAGAVALYATKGAPLHRRSGMVFVVAMLTMTSTAVLIAAFARPNPVNIVAGALTFYMVCTAWLAVKRTVERSRGLLIGLMLAVFAIAAWAFKLGVDGLDSPDGLVGKVPPQPLFMFGTIGLLAGLLDVRLLFAGRIAGAHRIARHLWRMTFAMWVATASLFLGQPRVFPDFLRYNLGVRAIPVLLVAGLLVYWLVRTLKRRRRAMAASGMQEPLSSL